MENVCLSNLAAARGPAGSGERGSAYIIALLSLVVLSIIGISLAVITSTEAQLGGNERLKLKVEYAAEAGLNVGMAAALRSGSIMRTCRSVILTEPADMEVNNDQASLPGDPISRELHEVVNVSGIMKTYVGPCDLCGAGIDQDQFKQISFSLSADAGRYSRTNGSWNLGVPLARSVLTRHYATYPVEEIVDEGQSWTYSASGECLAWMQGLQRSQANTTLY